jgi:hypothetical protein
MMVALTTQQMVPDPQTQRALSRKRTVGCLTVQNAGAIMSLHFVDRPQETCELRAEVFAMARPFLETALGVQAINATPSGVQWSWRVIVMAHMGRPGLSVAQKADLWQRGKQGQSLSEIGRALGKHAGSIHGVVASNGGFIPAAAGGRARR